MIIATVAYLLRESDGVIYILLGKRKSKKLHNGLWNGLGGKCENGESVKKYLKREVWEEGGIKIDLESARMIADITYIFPKAKIKNDNWRVIFYSVTKWSGKPKPVEGFTSFRWFRISRLPEKKLVPCQRFWLPVVLGHHTLENVLKCEVLYKDRKGTKVGKIKFGTARRRE